MAREPIVSANVRPRGERRAARWPLALVVLAVLGALAATPFLLLRPGGSAPKLTRYQVATVERGTMTQRVGGSGVIVPRVERSVLATEAGVVSAWSVVAGDEVVAGDAIATLRADGLHQELERARADVEAANRSVRQLRLAHESEAALAAADEVRLRDEREAAEAAHRLAEQLYELGALSRIALDDLGGNVASAAAALEAAIGREVRDATRRNLALEGAEATVAVAESELAAIEKRLDGLEVVAPVTGRVIETRIPEGNVITPGTVLAVVASTTELSVRVDVRESQASRVAAGQPVLVRVAGEAISGTVSWVAPQAHIGELGSMVEVAIDFDETPIGLRLGGSVSAEIEVGRLEHVLHLPRGLFLSSGGERFAFVIDGAIATRRSVVFGLVDGDQVQVIDGLEEGETVIVSSYDGFVDQTEVHLDQPGDGARSQ